MPGVKVLTICVRVLLAKKCVEDTALEINNKNQLVFTLTELFNEVLKNKKKPNPVNNHHFFTVMNTVWLIGLMKRRGGFPHRAFFIFRIAI